MKKTALFLIAASASIALAACQKPAEEASAAEVGFMMEMVPEILMHVKEDGKRKVTQRALVWTIMYGLWRAEE